MRPPVGCREKNSRLGWWAGRGWRRSMRGAAWGGRRRRGAARLGARRARHSPSDPLACRSSAPSQFAPRCSSRANAGRAVRLSAPLYMSKVLKSVLPVATAKVLPHPISQTEQSCTPLRVSTDARLKRARTRDPSGSDHAREHNFYFGRIKFNKVE